MPEFWQFPTGSMGLGPINAIYQARFMRYLEHRGILETEGRKIWAFVGDARWTSPNRSPACRSPTREGLDNLIFVVNCNLQRLDGPVRGNGSIVQELEGLFAGAAGTCFKLLWAPTGTRSSHATTDGVPAQAPATRRSTASSRCTRRPTGASTAKHFFNKYPELTELISGMSDADIDHLAPRRP